MGLFLLTPLVMVILTILRKWVITEDQVAAGLAIWLVISAIAGLTEHLIKRK